MRYCSQGGSRNRSILILLQFKTNFTLGLIEHIWLGWKLEYFLVFSKRGPVPGWSVFALEGYWKPIWTWFEGCVDGGRGWEVLPVNKWQSLFQRNQYTCPFANSYWNRSVFYDWLGGGEEASLKEIKLTGSGSCMSVITTLIDPTAEGSLRIFQTNLRRRAFHPYFFTPKKMWFKRNILETNTTL